MDSSNHHLITSSLMYSSVKLSKCNCLLQGEHKRLMVLVVTLLVICINIQPSASTSCASPPSRVKNGETYVQDDPRNGGYSNGSRAIFTCHHKYRVSSSDTMYCINGAWITADGREAKCVLNGGEIRCESPPNIVNGFYKSPLEESGGSSSSTSEESESYNIGTELQAKCDSSFNLPCDSSYRDCGRITCERDGTWSSRDGRQLITTCAAGPAEPVTSGKWPARSHALQNYLIIALAVVCVVGIGSLTVALMRRPLFCKKRNQGGNDPPVIVTSSPHHQLGSDLDSIPVAMNTGIFIPGADYDLQDYHLQDGAMVGTTVFK